MWLLVAGHPLAQVLHHVAGTHVLMVPLQATVFESAHFIVWHRVVLSCIRLVVMLPGVLS
jgi:hypothetical protein